MILLKYNGSYTLYVLVTLHDTTKMNSHITCVLNPSMSFCHISHNERRIRANDREFNAQFKYADNFIHTSKYSLLTFLPLNLLEQFQRLANFYFLCLLVLQLIPAISSLTPVTTAIPLIGVLTLTAVKDAYDDIQRHLSDSQVNNRKSKLLKHGKLVDAKWSGVQVGDVIRLENNQFVAADILLLTTSEPNGLCFIETAELDGETNLKCKQCLTETVRMGQDVEQLWTFNGEIICERPNNLLNKFDGTLIWRSQRYALDNEKILLRGCVLRNTQWCYGVVVFAGKDTKLMQNSGKTQFKSTGVDRLLNFIIIGIVLFLLSICAFFTVACAIWEGMMGQNFQVYLPWENIIPKDIAQGATVIGLLVFFSYAIVLNTVVPISLYVSVEVIRFVQSFLINWDEDMYYERTKTHAKARTTTLNEELGQIQYIFSDKTGTLTQNIMTFNKCSINGRTYGDVIDMRTGEVIEITDKQNNQETCNKSTSTTFLIHKVDVHPKTDSILVAEDDGVNTTTKTSTSTPITSTPSPNLPISAPSDVVNTASRTFDDSSPSILVTEDNGVNTMTKTSTSTPITTTPSPNLPISAPSDAVNTANRTFEDSSPSSLNSSNADIPTSTKRKKCYFNREESFHSISSGNIPLDTTRKSTRRRTGSESEKVIVNDLPEKTPYNSVNHNNNSNNNSNKNTYNANKKMTANVTSNIDVTDENAIITPKTTFTSAPLAPISAIPLYSPPSYLQSPLNSPHCAMPILNCSCKQIEKHHSIATKTNYKESTSSKTNANNNNSSAIYRDTSCCTQIYLCQNDHTNTKSYNNIYTCTKVNSKHDISTTTPKNNNNRTKTTDFIVNTDTYANNWTYATTHQKVHAIKSVDFSENPEYEPDFRWYDKTLLDAVRSDEEHAHNFFRLLALCHTVMAEYVDGRLEYQAQSPDEAALVSAARNFGFVFRSRTPNSITIEVMGRSEEYELLNILDFNNVRKRMSVILRRGNNIILYTKGADNVIYDRLSTSQEDIKARTLEHLNKFAGEGLRTLALAERRLDATYYNNWNQRFLDASISLDHREEKLNVMYEEIESELMLVGVTAIEDKLQDGVPHTIANLQVAGIKIWVLTGDKQETAINIGYSCQLLTDELADIFIVDGSSLEEVEKQLRQFKESIRIVNRFRPTPLEPAVNLNLNGAHTARRSPSSPLSPFRAQISPPPAPAISVVTFRWDEENIKENRGEPDSAEVSELYDGLEKGSSASAHHLKDDLADDSSGFAIVINGHSLVYCLLPELEEKFLEVALQCKAVICCRVTPLQKALVVELIKRSRNAVTLAIGDGANDVSMIKAAHIGVGISGQEGMQAVLASDYSIAQFRYLERLLLVHGRWSYYRMCKFLRYFFYKNFAFTLCHCWYSFFCGFSAQTVFDPMFISVYNLFYTSLPVLALGIFEQDVSDKHSVDFPKLYTPGLRSQLFNIREFVYSVLHGAFSSLILFLIPYGTYKDGVSPDGTILSDHMTLGAVVATILIIDNTAQIAIYTSYWTIFNHITIWGSLIWYFVLDSFYNYVIGGPYVGSLAMAVKDLTFWATMIITVVVIMAPVLAYKFYLLDVFPSLSDKIRFKRKQASLRSRQSSSVIRTPSSRRARRSLRSGYAFAHQEGFGRLITSGKIMRKLPQEFAFPLGLGSKKSQGATSVSNETTRGNQTSINGESHNSSMASVLHNNAGSGSNTSAKIANSDSISPRAPYQDLDTINL
ncbi:phospholipid-transporting ATPase ID-like [Teleopsis dalmanni]|uniref:phospholipid-transporting ATPase ID-like n=1 Tax=Teleopsis dalmanni TaxID=139649 RepID=UPI0018CDF31F|nr:phospholipid-transporting ATPase ID-like [Teleopsis dalmanni]